MFVVIYENVKVSKCLNFDSYATSGLIIGTWIQNESLNIYSPHV